MKLIENKDYVLCYNAKLGINQTIFIGTKQYLITIPKIKKEGVGFMDKKTVYFIGEKTIVEVVKQLLIEENLTKTGLIERIKVWDIPQTQIIEISSLFKYKISNKWYDKSIVIKKIGKKGHTPLCHSLGKAAKNIEQFYNN